MLDFNVPNNYREQNQNIFLATPGEQREQLREKIGKNLHNLVVAICRARGKDVLLPKFTRLIGFLRGWNMKIENISWGGRIQGQFWNILNKFCFEPVPSVILNTPTHDTLGIPDIYILQSRVSRTKLLSYSPFEPWIGTWGPSWCPGWRSAHSPPHAPRDTLSGLSSHPEENLDQTSRFVINGAKRNKWGVGKNSMKYLSILLCQANLSFVNCENFLIESNLLCMQF